MDQVTDNYIRLKNINKYFGNYQASDDINVTIKKEDLWLC